MKPANTNHPSPAAQVHEYITQNHPAIQEFKRMAAAGLLVRRDQKDVVKSKFIREVKS